MSDQVKVTTWTQVRLRLCNPCRAHAHDIDFRLDRDAHKMCEECRGKIMQIVRILTSTHLDAAVVTEAR